MSPPEVDSEEAISELTFTKEPVLDGMIRDLPPAQPSAISRVSSHSSLGQLDLLPVELLLSALNLLDFQSWSRFSRVSLRGKEIIEALPQYTDMMRYAPTTLTALGKTGLLHCHSAMLLQQTLRSDKCTSCFKFGGFLFLPTCERACFGCLLRNQSLWVTTRSMAKQCFGLTDRHLKRLPAMYSIPGTYHLWFKVSRNRVYRLVSVKQAKQLAVEVHGGVENVEWFIPRMNENITLKQTVFQQFHKAPLKPPGFDLSTSIHEFLTDPLTDPSFNEFRGVASVRFPFLSGTVPDRGRLCLGCDLVFELYNRELMSDNVISELVPPDADMGCVLLAMTSRLWSRSGFVEHIRHCYGAREILAHWA